MLQIVGADAASAATNDMVAHLAALVIDVGKVVEAKAAAVAALGDAGTEVDRLKV